MCETRGVTQTGWRSTQVHWDAEFWFCIRARLQSGRKGMGNENWASAPAGVCPARKACPERILRRKKPRAKAHLCWAFTARLKSRPDTKYHSGDSRKFRAVLQVQTTLSEYRRLNGEGAEGRRGPQRYGSYLSQLSFGLGVNRFSAVRLGGMLAVARNPQRGGGA